MLNSQINASNNFAVKNGAPMASNNSNNLGGSTITGNSMMGQSMVSSEGMIQGMQ